MGDEEEVEEVPNRRDRRGNQFPSVPTPPPQLAKKVTCYRVNSLLQLTPNRVQPDQKTGPELIIGMTIYRHTVKSNRYLFTTGPPA